MIRAAEHKDVALILPLLIEFWSESPFIDLIDVKTETVLNTVTWLIENESGLLHVFEKDSKIVGVIGFILTPSWFNDEHITAFELFWYVKPDFRGSGMKLYLKAVEALKRIGADTIEMGAVPPYQTTQKIYEKLGLTETDRKFMGALKHHGSNRNRSSRRNRRIIN